MEGLPERISEKIDFSDPEGCWEWTGCLVGGYGQVHWQRKKRKAPRVVYELLVEPIPDGLTIDHLCRNRKCVRPEHLEPVTMRENLRRRSAAVTHCPKGHEYTPENTYVCKRGYRSCKTCKREWDRKAYWAAKEAA